jgi:hypothetical protein
VEASDPQHDPKKLRLFIDPLKLTFKDLLQHNGNESPSVPIERAIHMKKSCDNMQLHVKHI